MNKQEKDAYWMDCIQQCRVSGLSDYTWCRQNGICTSSFYYNVKRLRKKASEIPAAVPKTASKQEVVPIHFHELKDYESALPKKKDDLIAIRLEFNGVTMAISNNADASIITATLKALQRIC